MESSPNNQQSTPASTANPQTTNPLAAQDADFGAANGPSCCVRPLAGVTHARLEKMRLQATLREAAAWDKATREVYGLKFKNTLTPYTQALRAQERTRDIAWSQIYRVQRMLKVID